MHIFIQYKNFTKASYLRLYLQTTGLHNKDDDPWKQKPPGGTQHIRIPMPMSVQEILRQPKNITSASMQPKHISSFYMYKPVHEHEISLNNANRSQDCLHRTQKYQYNDVWYQKISSTWFQFSLDPKISLLATF